MSYFKLAVIAFFLFAASAMAMPDAKIQSVTRREKVGEGLLQAEIKALIELKQVEKAMISGLRLKMMGANDDCAPSGNACFPNGPEEYCCSGSCVPHPMVKIFVCA
ncbi:uncharacterized protein LOC104894195 [Beta vulgaris subsp. vulgaris]|uniref:uncharacterized protein LOC104894195 n=1 Tax=Beta vulgaris subsp. vulgaris TaxID=3555 RepID=UPI002036AD3B|nr:uncharacterized protein LOC104894195 [Beta vulgaris subsp. vulgaris]